MKETTAEEETVVPTFGSSYFAPTIITTIHDCDRDHTLVNGGTSTKISSINEMSYFSNLHS